MVHHATNVNEQQAFMSHSSNFPTGSKFQGCSGCSRAIRGNCASKGRMLLFKKLQEKLGSDKASAMRHFCMFLLMQGLGMPSAAETFQLYFQLVFSSLEANRNPPWKVHLYGSCGKKLPCNWACGHHVSCVMRIH